MCACKCLIVRVAVLNYRYGVELAKANDVKLVGEMLLELCTLKTILEHGGVQNAMR